MRIHVVEKEGSLLVFDTDNLKKKIWQLLKLLPGSWVESVQILSAAEGLSQLLSLGWPVSYSQ